MNGVIVFGGLMRIRYSAIGLWICLIGISAFGQANKNVPAAEKPLIGKVDEVFFKDETLAATKADEFNSDELGVLKFSRDSEKRISGFEINAGRVRHLKFSREPALNRNQ